MEGIPVAVLTALEAVRDSGERFNLAQLDATAQQHGGNWRHAHRLLELWRRTGVVIADNRGGHSRTTYWRKK